MYESLLPLHVTLVISVLVLTAFFPYFTRRVKVWQKMRPGIRISQIVGIQLFAVSSVIPSSLRILVHTEVITAATEDQIEPWMGALSVLVLVYLCTVLIISCQKT